ncbi:MAG: DUF6356 family protein [Candidatus Marinimicrobia bacterium]|jgi:hypothetical protein|nr:DUF6356 family protein [Candidatus Neomarinimicrobiota bacterium]|tara:strand:- start:2037 stop:2411 length:375 start_codon:yes stop_codon:yes gene_type:complete
MKNIFKEHPNSVGETYIQHMKKAIVYSIKLAMASVCCMIHSLFPFLFLDTASRISKKIYDDVQYRLDKARNLGHTKDNIAPTNEFVRFIDRIRPSDSVESVARMNYMIEEFDDLYFIDRNKRRP